MGFQRQVAALQAMNFAISGIAKAAKDATPAVREVKNAGRDAKNELREIFGEPAAQAAPALREKIAALKAALEAAFKRGEPDSILKMRKAEIEELGRLLRLAEEEIKLSASPIDEADRKGTLPIDGGEDRIEPSASFTGLGGFAARARATSSHIKKVAADTKAAADTVAESRRRLIEQFDDTNPLVAGYLKEYIRILDALNKATNAFRMGEFRRMLQVIEELFNRGFAGQGGLGFNFGQLTPQDFQTLYSSGKLK